MADVKLAQPRLRVVLGDDSTVEVQTSNADLVRWDMTRAKQRWPSDPRDAPFLWLTFLAWAALKRTQTIPADTTWEAFSESTQSITNLDDEGQPSEDGTASVDPTQREPERI